MFKDLKLSTKIILMGLLINVSFCLLLVWMFPKFSSSIHAAKRVEIKELVHSASGIIDHFRVQAESGALPLYEAQDLAKEVVKSLRYQSGGNYYWIQDTSGKMVMHALKPSLEGKDLMGIQDPNGKYLFREMDQIAKAEGEGLVNYVWEKDGTPAPKISYVKRIPGWDWIIGSGLYIDDIEGEIWAVMSVLITVGGLMWLGAMVLAWWVARSIGQPVSQTARGLSDGAEEMSTAAGEIARASQTLAQGASEQAVALEETASSMEEMASMTKQNAGNAGQADALMKETSGVVEEAGTSMGKLTASMEDISKASAETSQIIKTIDEIAFQTNLLALNAAVEAARAGEAGAGFAVVAEEVRSLAMRAGEAARNTANLIDGTVTKVQGGSRLVEETNSSFGQVAESVRKVAELINEIAAASDEQSRGIDQVSHAVQEMDKTVQANASSSEEAAAVAEEMSAQAEEMKRHVGILLHLVEGNKSQSLSTTRERPKSKQPPSKLRSSDFNGNGKREIQAERLPAREDSIDALNFDQELTF